MYDKFNGTTEVHGWLGPKVSWMVVHGIMCHMYVQYLNTQR